MKRVLSIILMVVMMLGILSNIAFAVTPLSEHVYNGYKMIDSVYCISCCSDCGVENPAASPVKHRIETSDVAATDIEAAHKLLKCADCEYFKKEYKDSNVIRLELKSEKGAKWNGSAIIVLKNGEPLTFVKNISGYSAEVYALPYDSNSSYSFMWLDRNSQNDVFGAAIYFPGNAKPVFKADDMSLYDNTDMLYSHNVADYSKLFELMARMPEAFEYYTQASVDALAKAITTVRAFLPSSRQAEVNAMTSAVSSALGGLVATDRPSAFGLINLCDGVYIEKNMVSGDMGYYLQASDNFYSYEGKYTVFGSMDHTDGNIEINDSNADITMVNIWTDGRYGNLSVYGNSDVSLTALGINILVSEKGSSYAGIEICSNSTLTITKNSEAIIAVGDDNCAGIGSYYYEKSSGEPWFDSAGAITINGGTLLALATDNGAGIGGSYKSGFENITINGGRVYAGCLGNGGADIGVGNSGEGGNTVINGGNIISDDVIDPTPKNSSGKTLEARRINVHKSFVNKEITIELAGIGAYKAIAYGTVVYLYLPVGARITNEEYLAQGDTPTPPAPTPTPPAGPEIKDTTKIFKDVEAGKWYVNAINYSYSYGFIAGVASDRFGVGEQITRGMFITILARIAGVNTEKQANNVTTKFTDVESGRYYTNAIKWASENKIVNGITTTTFEPNTYIQRQQLCVMIVNFAKHQGVDVKAVEAAVTFGDASAINDYAKAAVADCQMADIVNGYNEGGKTVFKPTNTATRAEAAQILYKFHKDFVSR